MLAIGAEPHRFVVLTGILGQAASAVAFRDAHRLRCASAMRLRVAALNRRLFLDANALEVSDGAASAFTLTNHLGGRPRRFVRLAAASRSTVRIASSRRSFSERSSASIL